MNNLTNQPSWDDEVPSSSPRKSFGTGPKNASKVRKPLPSLKTNKPGFNTDNKKSARELQRDKVLRQQQLFNAKKMKELLPDPEEVRKAEQMKVRDAKMKDNVREILDVMMPQVVTEVSLKLGGAMYAQENAIKNIVDDYIKQNPVIEDRNNKMQNDLRNFLIREVSKQAAKMETEVPENIMRTIEKESLSIFRNEMEKMDGRIDTCRQGLNSSRNVQDDHKDKITDLDTKIAQLNTDLAVSCGAVKTSAEDFSKTFTEQKCKEIDEKISKMDKRMHKDHKNLGETAKHQTEFEKKFTELQKKQEEVTAANEATIKAMEGQIKQLQGRCCSMM